MSELACACGFIFEAVALLGYLGLALCTGIAAYVLEWRRRMKR